MYKIKEAALRAGVSIPLLRAWERRYGIVHPSRTPSGYRLYDEPSIERLRAMRQLVDAGWAPSQAAWHLEIHGIPPDGLDPATVTSAAAETPASLPNWTLEFVAAAAALDERRLERLLDNLFAAGSFERVIDDRLMPALRALGEAWVDGKLSVGSEHAASYAVVRRLSASFEAAGGVARGRPVLVGLPPGSRHEIGSLAFATAVRRRGLGVVYLGADVPSDSWVEAIRVTGARAVVVGVPTPSDRATAEEVTSAAVRARDGLLVAIGGPAAGEAAVGPSVIRFPDGIGRAAELLDEALAPTDRVQTLDVRA